MKKSYRSNFMCGICILYFSITFGQEPVGSSNNEPRPIPFNYQGEKSFDLYQYNSSLINTGELETRSASSTALSTAGYYTRQFIVAETSGVMWMVAGTFAASLVGVANKWENIEIGLYIAYAGYSYGVADGVYRMGRKEKRNGSRGWSLTGAAAGMGLGITATHSCDYGLFDYFDQKKTGIIIASIVLLPTIGSMTAYNLTQEPEYLEKFSYSPEISVGQLGYYQDACGGLGVRMDLLSCRF